MEEDKGKIDQELKEIIIFRILSSKLPKNIELSIGGLTSEPLNAEDIVKHIRAEDEIGKTIIEMELNYLKALKEGIILKIQNE